MDIMKKLLLVKMEHIVEVGRKRRTVKYKEHVRWIQYFAYIIRGYSNINRKSTNLGVREII